MNVLSAGTVCCHGDCFLWCWAWETLDRTAASCGWGLLGTGVETCRIPARDGPESAGFLAALAERGTWGLEMTLQFLQTPTSPTAFSLRPQVRTVSLLLALTLAGWKALRNRPEEGWVTSSVVKNLGTQHVVLSTSICCAPASPGCSLGGRVLGPTSDPQIQNLHLSKLPRDLHAY